MPGMSRAARVLLLRRLSRDADFGADEAEIAAAASPPRRFIYQLFAPIVSTDDLF